jgi:L-fuconolactonase
LTQPIPLDAESDPTPSKGRPWRVDSHVHLWDAIRDLEALRVMPAGLHGPFTLATLERELDAARIAGVVLIEAGSEPGDLAYADLDRPALGTMLDSLAGDAKFVGVRFRFEGKPAAALDDARLLAAARSVMDRDLVLELLVGADHLPGVRRLVRELPYLRVVVDHLAKPDLRHGSDRVTWLTEIEALARETSVAMKLSVSPRAADLQWLADRGAGGWTAREVRSYVSDTLEAFGPDRVAWGSDWPVAALGGGYGSAAKVIAEAIGSIDVDIEAQIFAGTARRIYRLPE